MVTPVSLAYGEDRTIIIRWSSGVEHRIPFRVLRDRCPCATCREQKEQQLAQPKKSGLTILKPEELAPLSVTAMRPVGNYGYSIQFSDRHSSGIYTFAYLFELGEQSTQVT